MSYNVGDHRDSFPFQGVVWRCLRFAGSPDSKRSVVTQNTQAAFFSYCREDSDFALKLAGDLKAAGASVWLDQLNIKLGQRWDQEVEDALTNCPRMVVILSPASVASTNVMDEVSFALEEQKTVIPVIYRDCTVPFRLRRVQRVDFREEYERGLQRLLDILAPGQNAGQNKSVIVNVGGSIQSDAADAEEHSRASERVRFAGKRQKAAEMGASATLHGEQTGRATAKKGMNIGLIGALASLLVLIIALGWWFVFRHRSAATENPSVGTSASEQWNSRVSGTVNDLRSIIEIDGNKRLWVVGYKGTIMRSDDGEHWNARSSVIALDRGFVAPRNLTVLVNGQECTLTAGDVITRIADAPDADERVKASVSSNQKSDCATGRTVAVRVADLEKMQSHFEGQLPKELVEMAKRRDTPSLKTLFTRRNDLSSIFGTSDGKRLWAVGSEGTVLESDDGGEQWDPRTSGTHNWLHSIFATSDGRRLWAVGGGGTIVESDDAGKSWIQRSSGTENRLSKIFGRSDGKRLWAVGDHGTILESDDSGEHWISRDSGTRDYLYSIFGTSDGTRVWAVGGIGTIRESDDGGEHWARRDSGTTRGLYSIFGTSDGKRLWAVGYGGTILKSNDGGMSWAPSNSGTGNNLEWIVGTGDGRRLWVVGDKGTILEAAVP